MASFLVFQNTDTDPAGFKGVVKSGNVIMAAEQLVTELKHRGFKWVSFDRELLCIFFMAYTVGNSAFGDTYPEGAELAKDVAVYGAVCWAVFDSDSWPVF